jgi:predicted Zn-dependent protease
MMLTVAVAAASCAPPHLPEEALASYVKAKGAYQGGDLAGAETVLAPLVSRGKVFPQAEILLGKVYYFQDRLPESEALFRRLLSRSPRHNEAEIWLVRTSLQQGKRGEAQARLEELLSRDPGDPRLLSLLGTILQEDGDVKGALELYQRASVFGEELAKVHLESARLYYQFDLPEKALRELAACTALMTEGSLLREPVARLTMIISRERGQK